MKPLIYKGRHKDTREWVSSDEIRQQYNQIQLMALENQEYKWVKIHNETLCVDTGAVDVTKRRIFSGDIIEYIFAFVKDEPMQAIVYYNEEKYQWRCKQLHDAVDRWEEFDLAFIINNGNAKIIGNIHDGDIHE